MTEPISTELIYHFTGRPRGDGRLPDELVGWRPDTMLENILREGYLRAYEVHHSISRVVCFSEFSTSVLQQAFSNGLSSRGAYSPWGIILRKSDLVSAGIRPVLHLTHAELAAAADVAGMRDLRVRYELNPPEGRNRSDWTHEREWRWVAPEGEFCLPVTRSSVVGVFVGHTGWNPPSLASSELVGVRRYVWDGTAIVPDGWIGPGGYRFGAVRYGEIDWMVEPPAVAALF